MERIEIFSFEGVIVNEVKKRLGEDKCMFLLICTCEPFGLSSLSSSGLKLRNIAIILGGYDVFLWINLLKLS